MAEPVRLAASTATAGWQRRRGWHPSVEAALHAPKGATPGFWGLPWMSSAPNSSSTLPLGILE